MTFRSRLRVIRFAAWFHVSFGVSILVVFPLLSVEMPRPFGSMEAYLQFMPAWVMATGFIIAGSFSAAAVRLRSRWPWLLVAFAIPQQLILLWGFFWGLGMLIETAWVGHEFDSRGWLGVCQLTGLSYYHGREVLEIWSHAWSRGRGPD